MKFLTLVMAGSMAATGAGARDTAQDARRTIGVCMNARGNAGVVFRAQAIASQILEKAGVRVEWRLSAGRCISIVLNEDTPQDQHPGALAYAMPFQGTRIVVFYDRVRDARQPDLLGHVLAHEITHILQGVNQHSHTGVMKQHWDHRDFVNMQWEPLGFTEEDIILIHKGLDRRLAGAPRQNSTGVTAGQ